MVQQRTISNGCGRKGGWLDPPSFLFVASCNQHDFYYWRGANNDDRLAADRAFLSAMLVDASAARWWKRWFYRSMAHIYYRSVRMFGKSAFTFRESPATWDDFDDEMYYS